MRESIVAEVSIWQTWKPYAVIVVGGVVAIWWWNSQSSFAALKDGAYNCLGVFVNESGKYEVLVDSSGNRYYGTATVQGGEVVRLAGDNSFSSSELASLTIRTKGDSHFQATDDPAMHSYNAIACDYAGN